MTILKTVNTRLKVYMDFEIIEEDEGLVFRLFGAVTATGLMKATVKGWQHPTWDTIRYQIWDFTAVTAVNIDNANALAFADMENSAKQSDTPMRIASIVADEKTRRICVRFSDHAKSENISAKTFMSERDAREWLAEGQSA